MTPRSEPLPRPKPTPMLLVRSLLFDGYLYGLMGLMGLACLPASILSRRAAWWSVRSYCRLSLAGLRLICGLRVEIRGKVPTTEVLVASKHQSFLDVLMHCATVPRPRFVMKRSLRWAPVLGIYAIRIGCVSVDRGAKGKAVRKMLADLRKDGVVDTQTIIYPQGTRVAPGDHRPYKIGAAALFEAFGMDCVPAATNAGVFWGRKTTYRYPGVAVLEYLEPIPSDHPRAEFMAEIEAQVEAASDRLLEEARAARG